ncbi:MAG: hypothetical protein LBQ66_06455, partial [Planctomycetaceae bacterium]|nr:hypothetical protein [Planctomycetaceae bacterium]
MFFVGGKFVILEYDKKSLSEFLDVPMFRVSQIYRWIFSRKVSDFCLMTDLSKGFRGELSERFGSVFQGREVIRQVSPDLTE